ncbi:MAG: hypothetical protein IJ802_02345 [Kiritimatiellae bacterium]|nr:hypothetical protein [Kiritimatiellia bacterium]
MNRIVIWTMAAFAAAAAQAADIYVSLGTGKKKNPGTQEAPLKNLWHALEKASDGDTIRLAEGIYPGNAKCNWFLIDKSVSIIGGYSKDFSERDPLKHRTMFQPLNENNDKKGNGLGIFTIDFSKRPGMKPEGKTDMVFDGLIFDDGFAQSYHPVKGKPEGVETGMWLEPPAKGDTPFASAKRYLVYSAAANRAEGDITFKNCLFLNAGNIAVNLNWFKGKVEMENNVFCNNLIVGANVYSSNSKPGEVKWEFENNTVLFTWSRTSELTDMGFGIRTTGNVESEIEKNIIGLSVLTGWDNTKGNDNTKKIKLEENVFFLNRGSDGQVTKSPSVVKVAVDDFEDDIEGGYGVESATGNEDLQDPDAFNGRINTAFLNAFLSMKYSEKATLDAGKLNAFRQAVGLPQQGTIVSKVDMFGNRYPLEDALKLFGAIEGKGAQAIK